MTWPLRAPCVGLLLVLASGCAVDPSSGSSGVSAQPSERSTVSTSPAEPSSSAPPVVGRGRGCDKEPIYEVMCRFVAAVQAGDTAALGEAEQDVAGGAGGDLPTSDYAVEDCALVGDVTVACEVSFDGQAGVFGYHVVPVNAEYDDGQLITPGGEELRYEVEGFLGTGERGEFASLP